MSGRTKAAQIFIKDGERIGLRLGSCRILCLGVSLVVFTLKVLDANMGVLLSSGETFVPEQLLNGTKVGASLQ
jgi:hypothetical protein